MFKLCSFVFNVLHTEICIGLSTINKLIIIYIIINYYTMPHHTPGTMTTTNLQTIEAAQPIITTMLCHTPGILAMGGNDHPKSPNHQSRVITVMVTMASHCHVPAMHRQYGIWTIIIGKYDILTSTVHMNRFDTNAYKRHGPPPLQTCLQSLPLGAHPFKCTQHTTHHSCCM